MTIFFTSDTHFDHFNIMRLCKRPFNSTLDMNETIIRNWNAKIGKDDYVYHLGDFGWGDFKALQNHFNRLNGVKVLITGNHDNLNYMSKLGWHSILEYHEVHVNKNGPIPRIVLFHYPIVEWNGYYRGNIMLHGHQHNHVAKQAPGRLDVGVDANIFSPWSLDEVLAICKDDPREPMTKMAVEHKEQFAR